MTCFHFRRVTGSEMVTFSSKMIWGAGRVEVTAVNPDSLSLFPRTHMVERES